MELAYHELNRREYELTKHVSLRQVDPRALIELRTTGQCTVDLPEELFDLDGPGHYFRRLRSVAVSIPCVVGPYAGVNCTLTLLQQLDPDQPLARRRRLRPRRRGHRPVQRLLRRRAVHRHQLRHRRQRPVRDQPGRRAVPAVRRIRGGQPVAARTARPTCRSSTTTRSPTSCCTCATRRARAGWRCARRRRPRCSEKIDGGRDRRLDPAAVGAPRVPDRVGPVHQPAAHGGRRESARTADADPARGALPVLGAGGSRPLALHEVELFASAGDRRRHRLRRERRRATRLGPRRHGRPDVGGLRAACWPSRCRRRSAWSLSSSTTT